MDSANLQPALELGRVVAGKYRIDRTLAEGGMGVVVAATHIHLDQIVALKFLRGDLSCELDALARFTREARAAAQLRSEHVARVLDAGVTDDGTPYIAMEYLEGQSLAAALQSHGPMEVARAVEYVIQTCEGLAEAHARGIVHRDIKPYNLFLVERSLGWSAVKILDFGISKFAFPDASNVATGVIIGSPCYMSPEQLRSTATVDHRTDIWSVGATLYELIAGRAAFDASQTLHALIAAILDQTAPDVCEVRADVPPELSAIIAKCLAKDRDERFESAGDLAMALLPFGPGRSRVSAELAASMRPAFPRRDSMGNSDPPAQIASVRPLSSVRGTPLPPVTPSNELSRAAGDSFASNGLAAAAVPPRPSAIPAPLPSVIVEEPPESKITDPSPPAGRRRLVNATVAAGVLVLGVVAVRAFMGKAAPAPVAPVEAPVATATTTQHETQPQPPPVPVAPTPPAVIGRIELVVRASPSGARITIDDRSVDNPYVASFPKDGTTHRITARAWGYDSKYEDVSFDADMIVDLGLYRHPSGPIASSPPPPEKHGASGAGFTEAPPNRAASGTQALEVDTAGGRAPLHPIETKDPYGTP